VLATGSITSSGLYTLDLNGSRSLNATSLIANLDTWHQRLAHVSPRGILMMKRNNVVEGLNISSTSFSTCTGCIAGKGHRIPFPKSRTSAASRLLELVHSDIMGPFEVDTLGGSRYVITFIDDFSKWAVIYTMKAKSEALKYLRHYKNQAEVHTNKKLDKIMVDPEESSVSSVAEDERLKVLRSDNGGEYLSNTFKQYLSDEGIKHELTVPYTPQQNGTAERMNRTILDLTRSMLHHKNISKRFWGEAMATAVYVRNRVTSRSLPPKLTPYHLWYGTAPNISHLRIFGSPCG